MKKAPINFFSILSILTVLFVYSNAKSEVLLLSEYHFNSVSSALANSNIAFKPSDVCVYTNPAGLASLEKTFSSATYTKDFSDIYMTNISFGKNFSEFGFYGLSVAYLNYGKFNDIENNRSYEAGDLMTTLSFGRNLYKNIALGANLKYLYSKIDEYNSSALALDFTSLLSFFDKKIYIGGGFYNVGFQMDDYAGVSENLASSFKFGISNKLDKLPFQFGAQYSYYFDDYSLYGVAAEFTPKENLKLRGGYNFSFSEKEIGTNSKSEKFAGLSFGCGVIIKNLNIDFSYLINGELEDIFSVSLSGNLF